MSNAKTRPQEGCQEGSLTTTKDKLKNFTTIRKFWIVQNEEI